MFSNAQIRAKAREMLGNNIFSSEWLYSLIIMLVISVVTAALSATGIGSIIVYGLLMCASAAYFAGRARGTVGHKDLGVTIEAIKVDAIGSIFTGVLQSLFIALWSMLFVIPGIVKSCSYAMAFYVKNDNPTLSANEAITESRRLMDGYKMQYFLLQLSFIGWIFVGSICFGIGSLWVAAYMEAAKAAFYEEVKAAKNPVIETTAEEIPTEEAPAEEAVE